MKFSIIYSFDCPKNVSVKCWKPKTRSMQQTEDDDQYEFGHLGGNWEKGKHRKYAGILTKKQFDAFVTDLGLRASKTETMGSIGAPGFIGMAPAVCFELWSSDPEGLLSAYVTPMPDVDPEWFNMDEERATRAWNRIKRALLNMYG